MARPLKLLVDMVAVLRSSGDPEVRAGDVGTVVELLAPEALEVEFVRRDGRTRHIGTLSIHSEFRHAHASPCSRHGSRERPIRAGTPPCHQRARTLAQAQLARGKPWGACGFPLRTP